MKQNRSAQNKAENPRDPRTVRGFKPEWYPRADGQDPPAVDAEDRHDGIRLEFLSLYYQLNRSYARLLEARRARENNLNDGKSKELAALKQVEKVLQQRDALEDQYAPLGVIAEPEIQKGFTVDLKFNFGARPVSPWDVEHVSSCYISIPLPPGVESK